MGLRIRWNNLKYKIHLFYIRLFKYVDKDYEPLKCYKCGCKEFKDVTKDSINYTVCESESFCIKCGNSVGYWAYGYWER
jgi:hypothetical protein